MLFKIPNIFGLFSDIGKLFEYVAKFILKRENEVNDNIQDKDINFGMPEITLECEEELK